MGQVVEADNSSEDTVTILDESAGEEVEVKTEELLPEDTKYVETTVKAEDGNDVTVEGAVLSETSTTTTVVALKTGKVHEVEKNTTTTTIAPVVTRTTTEIFKEETTATTTKRETEETSERITETVSETTKTAIEETTSKPTVKETTTTAAPTTAATTTAAPTPVPQSGKIDTATVVSQAFAEVNLMRAEVGTSPVVMSPQLAQDYAMLRSRKEADQYTAGDLVA